MLGTTEKHYQSLESADQGKQSFYNARISLQYTSISCVTYRVNELMEHTFISCQFIKQVYCFVYFQASEEEDEAEVHEREEENNIKVTNIKEAGPVQFTPLSAKQRQATCKLVDLKNQKPGQELKYVNVGRVCNNIHPNPPSTHRAYRGMVTVYLGPCAVQ